MAVVNPIEREPYTAVLAPISDADLRSGTVDLFDRVRTWIAEDDIDLVILSARRLACLYEMLVEHGMEPLTGCLVVSDRFLDVTTEWHWRNVVVLDDTVVLGTTLHRLCRDLRARQTPDGTHPQVRSAAIVVDKGQAAPYLLEDARLTALHTKTSSAVEKFSVAVVQILFGRGIPFFSDFPATRSARASLSDWAKWLDDDAWFVADVTAPLLSQPDRFALVQIPKAQTVETVHRRLLPEVARLVENFKIRSYVHVVDNSDDVDTDVVSVRLVPIAMLRPTRPAELDEALAAMCAAASDPQCPIPQWSDLPPDSKHRLVQMFASAALLRVTFAQEAWHRTFDVVDIPWDVDTIALYFGEYTSALLPWLDQVCARMLEEAPYPAPNFEPGSLNRPRPSAWLQEHGVLDVLWQQRELLEQFPLPAEPDTGHLTRIGLVFAHCITSVFGYVSKEFERPQRRRIARLNSLDEYDDEFGDENLRILNQGITLRELTTALGPSSAGTSSWARSCLSLGIDVGNDLGVIVPDTRYDPKRDLVYRCYRMGETAPLVDTPLSTGVWTAKWDRVTRQADTFPVESFTQSIITHLRGDGVHQRGSLDGIEKWVLRVLPGRLKERYDGEVTDVERSQGTFVATLTPGLKDRGDQLVAVMNLSKVPEDRSGRLRPGTRFRWSVYEKDFEGTRDSTSRISLTRSEDLDLDKLSRDAQALAERDHRTGR